MLQVEHEQVIHRPPPDVFHFVATDHFANHPKWDSHVVEMTPTSAGQMRQGSTARLVRDERGKRIEGTAEVTEYEPDHAFAIVDRFGPFTLHQRATFEKRNDGGTRLYLSIATEARGPIRLLLPLLKGQFRKTMAASLESIKRHIEAESGNQPRHR